MRYQWRGVACIGAALLLSHIRVDAVEIGLFNPYITTGARISPETLVPAVRKWYLPQTLYHLYQWKGYDYTNYAKERYSRYVATELEGDRYYDLYGNYITKGWNIYSWNQEYPREFGSGIWKDPKFSGWFQRLVVSSSSKGQFHSAISVGEGLRTTMTPLTFSKPVFDGLQWDLLTDKYAFSVVASRIDNPAQVAQNDGQGPSVRTIFTQLLGMHGTVQLGDFVNVGGSYLTAFHQNSGESLEDNSLRGVLGGRLNAGNVQQLIVRLSDDSPEDGEGGALLLRERLFIDGVEHPEIAPLIEGGIARQGLIEASGSNTVTLTYNIPDFVPHEGQGADFREIAKIEVGLVVANDYKIEVSSNMQTNRNLEPAFLLVERAKGNITDASNQRFIKFQYGLPSGNELRGLTLQLTDVKGFNLQSEFVNNRRNRRFPNQNIRKNQALASDESQAFYVTASQIIYPFFAYGETFTMDSDYSTSMFISDAQGFIDYENENSYVFELVEDNDDQDRFADWTRRSVNLNNLFFNRAQTPDQEVFPGLDENQDFISDFNQNQNNQPDYVEPFFRYHVDPPEFLFGTDMNNNTIIDRFENDTEADYPYKRDHKGYNWYAGAEIRPKSRFIVGRTRTELHSNNSRSESTYGLLTLHHEIPRRGLSIQLMEFARRVHDNIPDHLIQWVQPSFSTGALQDVPDRLIAQNTFINTLYLEVTYNEYLPLTNKLKLETYQQQGKQADLKRNEKFFGLINKADYRIRLGESVSLWPQWKQTLSIRTPSEKREPRSRDLSEVFFLLLDYRISSQLGLGIGTEYEIFENLRKKSAVSAGAVQDDFSRWTLATQLSNTSAYLGYHLMANLGFRWVRRSVQGDSNSNVMAFVDIFAGVGTDQ